MKEINWNLLAQKVVGKEEVMRKSGEKFKKLDLAEILFGMLKVFLLLESPHTI